MIRIGDKVVHPRFGRGVVIAVEHDELYVRFDSGSESRVLAKDCRKSRK